MGGESTKKNRRRALRIKQYCEVGQQRKNPTKNGEIVINRRSRLPEADGPMADYQTTSAPRQRRVSVLGFISISTDKPKGRVRRNPKIYRGLLNRPIFGN